MAAPAPWRRSVLLSLLAGVAVGVFGNVLGLGLPGGLALAPAAPIIWLIYGVNSATMFPPDTAWPFAIMVTFLMGPLVPVLWLGTRMAGLSGARRALAVCAGMVLGSALIAVAVYAVGVAPLLE